MKKGCKILLGILLLVFPIISCNNNNPKNGVVCFQDRKIDIKSILIGFPYSSYNIKMSEDATKLFYLKNGETSPLMMLDLSVNKNLDEGVVICNDDFAKKSFWKHVYNSRDNSLYWTGDEKNDEIINLYRLSLDSKEVTKLTNVPYIYGWDFNKEYTKIAYIARMGQNENRLDELHIIDLLTMKDEVVYLDKPDYRMTWSEISFSPDNNSVNLLVLKDANRTYTSVANIDIISKKLTVISDSCKPASLSGSGVISPWYSERLAFFTSNQNGYSNIYSFDKKSGKTTQITDYSTDNSAKWIKTDNGENHLIAVQKNPGNTSVIIINPIKGNEVFKSVYNASLDFATVVGNTAYFFVEAVDIVFQIWALTYKEGALHKEVILELPKEKNDKLVTSTVEKLSIPTFDRDLHAYLLSPTKPLPKGKELVMIQSFYGGENSYDMEHQIYTAAGIYVLSPSPRGSAGFGRDFAALNDKDLGGNEIIDIINCAKYISEKLGIPPERIGVFGMSHGGYATMRLMTFPGSVNGNEASFPFGFGVAVAGFADIIYQHEHSNIPDWTFLEAGDPIADREKLIDRSPISHTDLITGPLLLIHGNHDDRVNIEGSRMMYNALKKSGKPVEFLEIEGQGHGVKGIENNLLYYRTIFHFLENLKSKPNLTD